MHHEAGDVNATVCQRLGSVNLETGGREVFQKAYYKSYVEMN